MRAHSPLHSSQSGRSLCAKASAAPCTLRRLRCSRRNERRACEDADSDSSLDAEEDVRLLEVPPKVPEALLDAPDEAELRQRDLMRRKCAVDDLGERALGRRLGVDEIC